MEERRTDHFVEPKLQLPVLGLIGGSFLVSGLLLGSWIYSLLQQLQELIEATGVDGTRFWWFNVYFGGLTTAAFVLSFISLMLYGLIVSNRLFGPIYRLKNKLKKLRQRGVFKPISIRRSDLLHDLLEELNRTLRFFVDDDSLPGDSSEQN